VPTSVHAALTDPSWRHAMEEEYDALITNNTWDLVPHPVGSNVITGKWIFTHKFNYYDTFSPAVKPATICTVLSLAVSRS
jgi:hypothetical protein